MIERIDKETGEVILYTQEEFLVKRHLYLQMWNQAKAALESAKESEMSFRKMFVDFASDPDKKEGVENIDVGDGLEAKVSKKLTYSFIQTPDGRLNKKAIDKALSTIEDLIPENAEEFVDSLVKWTPSLSLSVYRTLDPDIKQIMDSVVVTKEAAPSLEIKSKAVGKRGGKK